MKIEKLFPTLMIVLAIAAAACYIPSRNWRMVIYWLAAATLNTAVTY